MLSDHAQVAMFCVSAIAGGAAFWRWLRLSAEGRRLMWSLYGRFTGLMFCGSCFGIAACGSNMKQLELYFIATVNAALSSMTPARLAELNAESYRWWAAYFVFYSFEFLCLSIAILIMLERMISFAASTTIRRLAFTGRIVLVAIVAGNAAGVTGNIATAVYLGRTADYCDDAAAAFANNNTAAGHDSNDKSNQVYQSASEAASVQRFSEVAVLLITTTSFVAAGVFCSRVIRAALRNLERSTREIVQSNSGAVVEQVRQLSDKAGNEGRMLQRRVVATVAVVFTTFVLRAAFSVMNAFTAALQNVHAGCPSLCATPCNNTYALMQTVLTFRPEVQVLVILISSPMALLVALWGMSNARALNARQNLVQRA